MSTPIAAASEGSDLLEAAAAWSVGITRRISAFGVFVMLAIAGVTMFEVVFYRSLFGETVLGLNEIVQTFFAAAIAAAIPGGVAKRASLRADIVLNAARPQTRLWLDLIAETLLLVFLVLVTVACYEQTLRSLALRSETAILHIPTAPVVGTIAAFFAVCVLVQTTNVALVLREATRWRERSTSVAPIAAVILICVTLAAIAGIYWFVGISNAIAWNNPTAWAIGIFGVLWLLVLAGVPVSACLGFCGLAGASLLLGWDKGIVVLGNETTELFMNANLALIPLFLMMGALASVAGLSKDIYRLAQATLGSRRGGLAMATVGACAGFGALTGSSIATAATIGTVAMPQMEERGYARTLSAGCIAAGSTLGQLVPPSTIVVLYALLVEESIGKLYMAILVPALLTLALYLVSISLLVRRNPDLAPEAEPFDTREFLGALNGALVVLLIFSSVIGGIYFGIFTANEAASVGVVLTFLAALFRGKLNGPALWAAAEETTKSVAMVYPLVVGALMLTFYLDLAGLPTVVTQWIGGMGLSPILTVCLLAVIFIALGSVMDSVAVMIITAGIVAPLVTSLGFDAIWWGVMMLIIVELGVVTPPFGLNLFMLKSIAPQTTTGQIYRGVLPFIGADLIKIALLIAFPALALWLPATMR